MNLAAAIAALEAIAPLDLAESWDNVGLLAGDPAAVVRRAVLCIDCTAAVVDEAASGGAELVVAYHPPIFRPITRLAADHPVARALARGIAIYSPHTALDAAAGGVNDVLAAAAGIAAPRPLVPANRPADLRLVFFAPAAATEAVVAAVCAAGAGVQGPYAGCRFSGAGRGHFQPLAGARPAVGEVGAPTAVDEVRTEVLVPPARVAPVVAALRRTHPYQEPTFDLLARQPDPAPAVGAGRIGAVAPQPVAAIAARLRDVLGLRHLLLAGDAAREVRCVAVAAGAGAALIARAAAAGAELLVTGELAHHDALRARALGLTCLATLHSHSERVALAPLGAALRARCPELAVHGAACDDDPWQVV